MTEPRYFVAPSDWTPECDNPFSEDGVYGPAWSYYQIVDSHGDRFWHGRGPGGLWGVRAERCLARREARLADFLRYESDHGRAVVVAAPSGVDVSALVERALRRTPAGAVVRSSDPRWAVHSTPAKAWPDVRLAGRLDSLGRLRARGASAGGVGRRTLGEPPDYAEYVDLSAPDAIGPEHVVASHGAGRLITEEETEYEPGVRLYFDAHRIIRDGLAARDGVHWLKVRDHLPLDPYLRAAVGVKQVDPQGSAAAWTPRSFLDRAREHFQRLLAEQQQCGE